MRSTNDIRLVQRLLRTCKHKGNKQSLQEIPGYHKKRLTSRGIHTSIPRKTLLFMRCLDLGFFCISLLPTFEPNLGKSF